METTLRQEYLTMDAATLGAPATLPPIFKENNFQAEKPISLREDDELFADQGKVPLMLPYQMQSMYSREMSQQEIACYVLENQFMKAVFLRDYGGRLWSLYDKVADRELLYRNDCLQIANLALLNAWFSGGVEWNLGMIGHSPFTCSPMHYAMITMDDGTPALRIYQYERIREVSYQVDFFLDNNAPLLYARVRIKNSHGRTIPMYWWSNMALPEVKGARLVVPATESFCSTSEGVGHCDVPYENGIDITYPTNVLDAKDYFFKTKFRSRRYIAYFMPDGGGFFQTSTIRQRGRKLFVWGQGRGSDTWQKWLTKDAGPYIELQAGLGQTQYECPPMPPCAAFEWMEAYGALQAEPSNVFGDFSEARAYTEKILEEKLGEEALEELLWKTREGLALKEGETLFTADGWGALEVARREAAGEAPMAPQLDFGTVQSEQAPWVTLLETGHFPLPEDAAKPAKCIVSSAWQKLLETAHEKDPNWHSALQLALMAMAAQNQNLAKAYFLESYMGCKNPVACYGLAVLSDLEGDHSACIRYCDELLETMEADRSVLRDVGRLYLRSGAYAHLIHVLENSPALGYDGRLRLYMAQALSAMDRPEEAEAQLVANGGIVVDDLREGELILSSLYYRIQEQKAAKAGIAYDEASVKLPSFLNFRLKADE